MDNTAYQRSLNESQLKNLNTFLSDNMCLKGFKKGYEPKLGDDTLKSFLMQMNEEIEVGKELYVAPNQRYFMGAGDDPILTIITKVDDDNIYYYQEPWNDEMMIDLQTGADLLSIGSEKWLKNNQGRNDELFKSINAVANGKPGVEVSVEDLQPVSIQISYTGDKKGDRDPWVHLETEYNLIVNSVLNNKQTYNVRLNRKELKELEDRLSAESPSEKVFSISKIMMEDVRFLSESMTTSIRALAPGVEKEAYAAMTQAAIEERHCSEGLTAGDKVIFKGEEWIISGFISDGDKIKLLIIKEDFTKLADFVPIEKIKLVDNSIVVYPVENETDKARQEHDSAVDTCKETFLSADNGPVVVEFPTTHENGTEVHALSDKNDKKVKLSSASVMTETIDFKKMLRDLNESIKNDDKLIRRKKSITENMKRKIQSNKFDEEKAVTAYLYVVDESARKLFNENNKSGKFENWQKMFPYAVRATLARKYSQETEVLFKNKQRMDESVQEIIIDLCKKKLLIEGNTPEEENIEFTKKEEDTIESYAGFEMEAANVASVSWDDKTKRYKTELKKMKNPDPGGSGYVYYATTERNGHVEADKTLYSDRFDTEEDTFILKNFLSELQLARPKKI